MMHKLYKYYFYDKIDLSYRKLITIEGGVNDASGLANLGSITSGYYDTLDNTTVIAGSISMIIFTIINIVVGIVIFKESDIK